MAGPSGIKLNDLHLTERGQTTETFSPIGKLGAKTALWEAIRKKEPSGWSRFQGNLLSTLASFLFNFALFLVTLVATYQTLLRPEWRGRYAQSVISVVGFVELSMIIALVLSIAIVVLLEYTNLLRGLRQLLKFVDGKPLSEDVTFGDLIKLKSNAIHFGHVPLSFDVTDQALVVRSQGDRFVAVFARSSLVARLANDADGLAPWFGKGMTPPVVVEIEDGNYKSRLVIHGAYFETPGAELTENRKRATLFKQKITP